MGLGVRLRSFLGSRAEVAEAAEAALQVAARAAARPAAWAEVVVVAELVGRAAGGHGDLVAQLRVRELPTPGEM